MYTWSPLETIVGITAVILVIFFDKLSKWYSWAWEHDRSTAYIFLIFLATFIAGFVNLIVSLLI